MKGMTLRAMTQAVNGIYHGNGEDYDKEITAITIDSRKVAEGGLFIAIKGERSDGHDFIGQCFEKGAACVISEKELPDEERSYIQVESSLQALKDLALLYRNNLDVKVVGITGSVGKTSTKETISSVLSEKYRVLKTLGNFNNEIGLPLTVFRLTEDDEVAVLEMESVILVRWTDYLRLHSLTYVLLLISVSAILRILEEEMEFLRLRQRYLII